MSCSLAVLDCPSCHGDHESLLFTYGENDNPNYTHWATCPTTGHQFWMNTQSNIGVWNRLLEAAGVTTR